MHRTNLPDTQHYIPSLDGLRAGAVILVILSHFGLDNVVPGGFGVTAFFWISGYLITGQMLSEIGRTGRLDFPKFYLRRFFRLMPAAVFYILIAGSLFVAIGGVMPVAAWLSAIFYAANYYDLYVMFQPLASGVQSPLTHLWSLAVEEHFYILWPLALVTLYRRHWAVGVLLSVCLAVLAWRLWLYGQCFSGDLPGPPGGVCGLRVEYRLYKATDTRIDSIAWGALIAVLAAGPARIWLERAIGSRLVLAAATVALLGAFVWRGNEFREVWRYSLQGIALSVLIPAVSGQPNVLRRLLELPVAVFLGRLSYSLYLWHWAAVSFSDWLQPSHGVTWAILAVSINGAGALISFFAVEQPMVAFRRRFGSHATTAIRTA